MLVRLSKSMILRVVLTLNRLDSGVPLFARTSGQDSAPSVPIGTICVADVVPREEFTEAHRRVL